MNAPSEKYKQRIVEMFDSFCKTVSRNYSRNLKRAKQNHDKHFTQEPVELLLEVWGELDEYPSLPYTFHVAGYRHRERNAVQRTAIPAGEAAHGDPAGFLAGFARQGNCKEDGGCHPHRIQPAETGVCGNKEIL